jgi:cell division protein FtsB
MAGPGPSDGEKIARHRGGMRSLGMFRRAKAPKNGPKNERLGRHRVLLLERVLPILLLAVALVGAPVLIFSSEGMPRVEALEKELDTVERENAELRRDIDIMRRRVERLRDDPAAVERLARDELGLIRASEVVFQFPKEKN